MTLVSCSHGPKTVSGDLNQLLAESPTAAGAAPPSQVLPPIAVNPGDIAPWKNPYYANALAPGYWLEFSGSDWGTPIAQWKNSQLNELGYPRYLKRGKGLRAPLAGYGAAHPELSRGQVVLTWRGDADIRLPGATEFLADKSNAPATGTRPNGRRVYRFDGDAALSDLVIHRINAPVTDIKVWLPDPDDPEHASLEGELWHPVFIERLKDEDWGVIRATSLTQTNGSPVRHWNNRYRPDHVFATGVRHPRNPADPVRGIAGHRLTGVPYEHLVALANATDMDLWIDVPHAATGPFVRRLAKLLQFGSNGKTVYQRQVAEPEWAPLEYGRRVFVAYSDRLWSNDEDVAPQGVWAAAKAKEAGMSRAAFVAQRTAQVWKTFDRYFSDERLVRVAATSARDADYTREYLSGLAERDAERPDIVAVESYFGGGMPAWVEQTAGQRATGKDPWYYRGKGSKTLPADDAYWRSRDFARHVGEAFDEWQRRMQNGAAAGGLSSALVESIETIVGDVPVVAVGGPALRTDHLDAADPGDEGVTLFAQAMNRNERIADMYRAYLDAIFALGVAMHVPYVLSDDAAAPGQWGHLEHVAQNPDQAPKYQALRDYIADNGESPATPSDTADNGESPATPSDTADNGESPATPSDIADNGERPATPSDTEQPIVSAPPLLPPSDEPEAPPVAEPKPAVVGGSSTGTSTAGATELLADWRRPGNWQNCEKGSTQGTAALVDNRLRVTVKKSGKMGVRVYQKVTGLVPGRTYRVTGRRFRGSQKSVGVRVSKIDCYNGTLAQDYGFNDNSNIDFEFEAAKPHVYLSLYGGNGHAQTKSYIAFADLSMTSREASAGDGANSGSGAAPSTTTGQVAPAKPVSKPASTDVATASSASTTRSPAKTVSVSKQTAAATAASTGAKTTSSASKASKIMMAASTDSEVVFSSKPRFSQAAVDSAMELPLLRYAPTADLSKRGYPFGRASPGVHYLSLVAYIDSKAKSSKGKLVVERVLDHLKNVVKSGNAPLLNGIQKGWHNHHLGAVIALARHNGAVWPKLSADVRTRLDWLMRIGTYTGNWQHNQANKCYKDIELRVRGGYNPNQSNPMAAWMSYAYIYFGGASAVNKVLLDFDHAALIKAAKQYGWNWIVSIWDRPATKKMLLQGGKTSDGECMINPKGVRIPFVYNGKISTGDLTHPDWHVSGGPVEFEPFQILKRAEYEWNLKFEVVDSQHAVGKYCGRGHIKPGYKSPHLGKIGMFAEYNLGQRSSPDYVGWAAKQSLFHLSTLLVTGYWNTGTPQYDAVISRYQTAMDVLRYRDNGAKWFDGRHCKYTVALRTFNGGDFVNDLFDAFVGSGIKWRHAPVAPN